MAAQYPGAIAEFNGEGGTLDAAVTSATAIASGFSALQLSAPTTATWVAGMDPGQLAMRVVGSGAVGQGRFDTAKIGSRTELYGVLHIRFDTQPTGYTPILDFKQTDGGTVAFRISRNATGLLRLARSDLTTVVSMPAGKEMPLGQWVRIEWFVNVTTSAYRLAWFLAGSTTVGGELTGTAAARTDGGAAFGATLAQLVAGRLASPDHTTDFGVMAVSTSPLGVRASAAAVYTLGAHVGAFPARWYVGNTFVPALKVSAPVVDPAVLPYWGAPVRRYEFTSAADLAAWNVRDRDDLGLLPDTAEPDRDMVSLDTAAGILHLKAQWLADAPVDRPTGGQGFLSHRTGYIDQRNLNAGNQTFSQQWGRWAFRHKVPTGPRTLGALAACWFRNGNSGEIDLMESWGYGDTPFAQQNEGTSTTTIHTVTSGTGNESFGYTIEPRLSGNPAPVWQDFHETAMELTPETFRCYRDGQLYLEHTPATLPQLWGASFQTPLHMRINLHVGPSAQYWGLPDPNNRHLTQDPLDFQIDYVRAWALPA